MSAMISPLVPTSGAGMSMFGPIRLLSLYMKRREMFSSSSLPYWRGSIWMPPLPPPNGTSAMAVFQVISAASALKRSRETSRW